jgi:tRNA(His) 5'-end guanylyltransferase
MRRTPVIIRIDGCHFHTFTRGMKKPYDMVLKKAMWNTAIYLCEHIQNARLAYVQSDEISILLSHLDFEDKSLTNYLNYLKGAGYMNRIKYEDFLSAYNLLVL